MTAPHRFAAIDAWRGLCAVMVVFYHFRVSSHIRDLPLVMEAWRFVDFFFVLSGFIIAFAYSHRMASAADAAAFARRRFFRLWPLHAVILIGLVAIETARFVATGDGFGEKTSVQSIIPNLLLIHAWGFLPDTSWNGPSWSISTEIAAYAAFAIIFTLAGRRAYWAAAAVGALAAFIVITIAPAGMRSDYDFAVFRCLFGFMAGVLVYKGWQARPFATRYKTSAEVVATIVALTAVSFLPQGPAEALMVPAFALLVYVFASSAGRISQFFETRPLQLLGERSYSIYMIHAPLWYAVLIVAGRLKLTEMQGGVEILATDRYTGDLLSIGFAVLIVGLAALAYRLIENPGRQIGERLLRRAQPTQR